MRLGTLQRDRGAAVAAVAIGALLAAAAAFAPLAAALGLLMVVGFVVVVTRADLVLLVMVAALPWENMLGFPSETLSITKALGAVLVLAYVLRLIGNRGTVIRMEPLLLIVTLLGLWVGLSLVVAPNPAESIAGSLRYALFFVFFFLLVQLVDDREALRRVLRWFTASVALAALYALWLFLVTRTDYRVAGPVEDPNDFAFLLGSTLPLAAYLIGRDRLRRPLWIAAFVVIAAAMLATFSRGALVGVGVVALWGVCTRRVPLWVLGAALAAGLTVLALALTVWRPLFDVAFGQKRHIAAANTSSRTSLWETALLLTAERPIVGVGPGRYPVEALPLLRNNPIALAHPVTHNSYLETLSEGGVPALGLLIAFLAGAWGLLRRVQNRAAADGDADERRLATALQAALLFAVVAATFISVQLSAPFWLFGALAVVLARPAAAFEPAVAARRPRRGFGRAFPSISAPAA
ncbi:O-antigen ligase family protein [Conexibacter arvalis]|uniref:O-antigen ligase n=1 Tax=Conexibacter arvalis TaxID=912552 RepID=A0A840IBN4_9ACTN|nr:O-antigen ligase family protein [Conexibacter arvalis]MBB4661661.1 O-antigen ligase [Conexibacter arvalis]